VIRGLTWRAYAAIFSENQQLAAFVGIEDALTDNSVDREKAEEFATWVEETMSTLGVTGKYFCEGQHQRWRQHSIRAYLGQSPVSEPLSADEIRAAEDSAPSDPE
jgi:hypothetical protein